MKLSDSLLVSNASGNSRKYCFTMSATSYAWWFSNFTLSGSDSASCLSRCIRDRTPGFRNRPTWSRALAWSHRNADWMNGGNAEPFFCTLVINGTPKTVLSDDGNDNIIIILMIIRKYFNRSVQVTRHYPGYIPLSLEYYFVFFLELFSLKFIYNVHV